MANSSQHDALLEQVLAEYLKSPDPDGPFRQQELLARHPELADQLASFFRNRADVERIARPLRDAADTPTLGPSEPGQAGAEVVRYFGDYELLSEIARGGMGVVYRARQMSLSRTVAVKMILAGQLASADDIRRFRQEAEAAANLDHPHIVPIYEIGEHGGQRYFSMKLIEGRSLADELRHHRGAITPVRAAELIETVARAVHHAHQRGVLHRDLKPGNILLDAEGQPHVTDFGLAKQVEGKSELTQTGAIVGTPSYMPPEQASGQKQTTTASDVYSLGAILYELLTGQPPFRGATPLETLMAVMSDEPAAPRSHNPAIDRDLETIALKCLEKDPARRYDSAAALADELERWLRGEPILARAASTQERMVRWCARNPLAAGLAAAAILASVAGLLGTSVAAWRANVARDEANQRAISEAAARKAREATLYINQVARAHVEWQAGNARQAVAILEGCDAPRRNWEWHYVRRLCTPEIEQLPLRSGQARLVAYSPGGRYLAAAGEFQDLHLWDLKTGQYRTTPRLHATPILAIDCSADDTTLASLDAALVYLWDTKTLEKTGSFARTSATPWLRFSPDGKRLLVGTEIRDRAGSLVAKLAEADGLREVWWSDDGGQLRGLTSDALITFDIATGQRIGELIKTGDKFLEGVLTADAQGRKVAALRSYASGGTLREAVTVIDAQSLRSIKMLGPLPAGQKLLRAAFSPRGDYLAGVPSVDGYYPARPAPTLHLWDAAQGELRASLYWAPSRGFSSPAFSVDGRTLAWGGAEWVSTWRLPSRREATLVRTHPGPVTCVDWTADGSAIGSFSPADGLRVSDRKTHRLVGQAAVSEYAGSSPDPLRCGAALAPDGKSAIVISDYETRLVDLTRPDAPPRKLEVPSASNYFTLPRFSRDGKLLVATDVGSVFVWDAATGKLKRRSSYDLDLNDLQSVAISADGRRLGIAGNTAIVVPLDSIPRYVAPPPPPMQPVEPVRAAADEGSSGHSEHVGKVAVDVAAGDGLPADALRLKQGHRGSVLAIAFSPDGRFIATGTGLRNPNQGRQPNQVYGEVFLWDAAKGKLLHTLIGHTADITALAFTADGERLFSASRDSLVKVWDTAAGQEVLTLRGQGGPVHGVALSRGGCLAVAGGTKGSAGEVLLFDAAPLSEKAELPILEYAAEPITTRRAVLAPLDPVVLRDFPAAPAGLAYRRDGGQLAIWTQQGAGPKTIELRDPHTGNQVKSLPMGDAAVENVVYSADGTQLAVMTRNAELILLDVATGERKQTWPGAQGGVAWRGDGKQLAASAVVDGRRVLQLRNAVTGESERTLPEAYAHPTYSADGRFLAASISGSVVVWNVAEGKSVNSFGLGPIGWVRQNALSPDGSILAAAGTGVSNAPGSLVLWNVATGLPLRTLTGQGWMNGVEFSRDGRWLATSSVDRTVKVWEVATGQAAETLLGHEREVNAVVFSPDGEWVAASGEDGTAPHLAAHVVNPGDLSMIRFLKYLGLGLLLLVLLVGLWKTPYAPRYELPAKMCMDALSADQKTLVLLGPRFENDPTVSARMYDVATGSLKQTVACGPSRVLLLSRDGSRLVTGNDVGHFAAWDTASGAKLVEFEGLRFNWFGGERPPVSLDASGNRLAYSVMRAPDPSQPPSGRLDYEVRVWDLSLGKSLGPFPQAHPPFALSPDGRTLAAENGAKAIATWSVDRGELLASFPAHCVQPSDVVFSPDGQLLASAANNGALFGRDQGDRRPSEIKLYNVTQGREQASADVPQADFAQLHFDPSGTTLTGTMTLLGHMSWHVEPEALRPLPLGLREQVVSADGGLLAMTDGDPVNLVLVVGLQNQFLRIIDSATGKTRSELRLELPRDREINPQVAPAAFSADGQTLWVHVTCRDTFWHRLGAGRYGQLHQLTSTDLCGELWAVDVETQTVTARLPAQTFNVGLQAHLVEQGTLLLSRVQTAGDIRLAAWDVPPRRPIWLLALLVLLAAGVAGLLGMQIRDDLSAGERAPSGFKSPGAAS